jgi:hypothetical protein
MDQRLRLVAHKVVAKQGPLFPCHGPGQAMRMYHGGGPALRKRAVAPGQPMVRWWPGALCPIRFSVADHAVNIVAGVPVPTLSNAERSSNAIPAKMPGH